MQTSSPGKFNFAFPQTDSSSQLYQKPYTE